jgi:hypothetical protein
MVEILDYPHMKDFFKQRHVQRTRLGLILDFIAFLDVKILRL